jgi:hypothetical protein
MEDKSEQTTIRLFRMYLMKFYASPTVETKIIGWVKRRGMTEISPCHIQ